MKKALKQHRRLFPADAQPPEVLQPGDGSFDFPSSFVATQGSAVLSLVFGQAVLPVWRDQFGAALSQLVGQSVAVVGLVADDPLGRLLSEHEVKQSLHQPTLVCVGGRCVDRHGQAMRIDKNHDFHAFSSLRAADPVASSSGLAEGSVDETFVDLEAFTLLDQPSSIAQEGFDHAVSDPSQEPAMDRALAAEPRGKVLPFSPVVQDPEDARHDLSFIDRRPAAPRVAGTIGNPFTNPIQLLIREFQHDNMYVTYCQKVLG